MAVTQKQIDALRTADAALGTRIDKEVAARVAGDTALAARIAALEAKIAAPAPVVPPPVVPPPVVPPPVVPATPVQLVKVEAGRFVSAVGSATTGQTLGVTSQDITEPAYLSASGVTIMGGVDLSVPFALIRPVGRPNGLFVKGSRTTVRRLDFVGEPSAPDVYNDANGSALLEVLAVDAPVEDTLIEAVSFDLPAGAGARQHGLYVAGDVRRLIARRVISRGRASEGGRADGLTGWHDGTAPAQDIVFEDWLFDDHYNAVVYWLATATVTFRRCTFLGTLNSDIQVDTGGQVIVEGCRGSKGIIATSSIHPGTVVVDGGGNDWSWTP